MWLAFKHPHQNVPGQQPSSPHFKPSLVLGASRGSTAPNGRSSSLYASDHRVATKSHLSVSTEFIRTIALYASSDQQARISAVSQVCPWDSHGALFSLPARWSTADHALRSPGNAPGVPFDPNPYQVYNKVDFGGLPLSCEREHVPQGYSPILDLGTYPS